MHFTNWSKQPRNASSATIYNGNSLRYIITSEEHNRRAVDLLWNKWDYIFSAYSAEWKVLVAQKLSRIVSHETVIVFENVQNFVFRLYTYDNSTLMVGTMEYPKVDKPWTCRKLDTGPCALRLQKWTESWWISLLHQSLFGKDTISLLRYGIDFLSSSPVRRRGKLVSVRPAIWARCWAPAPAALGRSATDNMSACRIFKDITITRGWAIEDIQCCVQTFKIGTPSADQGAV